MPPIPVNSSISSPPTSTTTRRLAWPRVRPTSSLAPSAAGPKLLPSRRSNHRSAVGQEDPELVSAWRSIRWHVYRRHRPHRPSGAVNFIDDTDATTDGDATSDSRLLGDWARDRATSAFTASPTARRSSHTEHGDLSRGGGPRPKSARWQGPPLLKYLGRLAVDHVIHRLRTSSTFQPRKHGPGRGCRHRTTTQYDERAGARNNVFATGLPSADSPAETLT